MGYLNNDGVLFYTQQIKNHIPTKTSDITNDSGFITQADVPEGASPSSSTPLMDGTASAGTSTAYARGDHRHPSDSTKADAANVYTKTEVDNAIAAAVTNMYKYKGSVATVSALPASGNTTGDVYNVEESGMNYAWNGTAWDALGEIFTITAITNAEITNIVNQVFA